MTKESMYFNSFIELPVIVHKDSGYSFAQEFEHINVNLAGTTITRIPIPVAWWYRTTTYIESAGLKVLAVEWLKENWEGK